MTEPLSAEQLASVGWRHRQGIDDCGNQFHYYRLTAGQPDPVGRVRRDLPLRPPHRRVARPPAGDLRPARPAVLRDVPAAGGPALQPPVGRRHRHLHAVLRVLRHGVRRPGGVRARLHRPRRRRHPLRRERDARPARRPVDRAHRAGDGAHQAAAVPAGAVRLRRRPADPLVAGRRRPQRRPPQHLAADPRQGWAWVSTRDPIRRRDPARRDRPGGRTRADRRAPALARLERRRLPRPALARRDATGRGGRRATRSGSRCGTTRRSAC